MSRIYYRVHMHTEPSPGSTFYRGYVDVPAIDGEDENDDAIGDRAKSEAFRRGLYTSLVVDRIETKGGQQS